MTFDEDPANYDRWRPDYVPELFQKIIAYARLDETKKALEVGIGTGQATLPILRTGCRVTAVEIGGKLAAYSKHKFRDERNLKIENVAFEDYASPDGAFDLIYSATAFHWIPPETGYPKAFRLLKSGGALALFWNHPFVGREDDPLHAAIQKVYEKYRSSPAKKPEYTGKESREKMDFIRRSGFADVGLSLFRRTRTFDAESYVSLLNTYSDHRMMPEVRKTPFEDEIREAIGRFGGKLAVYDTMDLYLARKP